MDADLKVALVGNPNTGKSTLFNVLTGLNQKIGNFPGVTVDKKTGFCDLPDGRRPEILVLPGTYSLSPKSRDESIVFSVLADKANPLRPDLVVVILDASNLKRNLLLYTQVADLKLPVIVALNMMDLAKKLTRAEPEQQQRQAVVAGQADALVDAVEEVAAHAGVVGRDA